MKGKGENTDEFLIRVNREQLNVIDKCLDITSRLHAGQLLEFLEGFYANAEKYNKRPIPTETRIEIQTKLKMIKQLVGFTEGGALGISECIEFDKTAYDTYCQIRYFQSHEFGQNSSHSVYANKHTPLSKNKEIQIEKINPIKEKISILLDEKENKKR